MTGEDVEDVIVLVAAALPDVEIEVELPDPHDAPVVAAALAGNADAIVAGDRDLLEDARLLAWLEDRGVGVLSRSGLLDELDRK